MDEREPAEKREGGRGDDEIAVEEDGRDGGHDQGERRTVRRPRHRARRQFEPASRPPQENETDAREDDAEPGRARDVERPLARRPSGDGGWSHAMPAPCPVDRIATVAAQGTATATTMTACERTVGQDALCVAVR